MKTGLKFEPGDFITQSNSPQSFAIFGGDEYEKTEGAKGTDYSLLCYYNPSHYNQDSNGKWVRENVLEYEFEEDNQTCDYAINSEDFDFWRKCTDAEIEKALSYLAEHKRLAWEDKELAFRKLTPSERFVPGRQPVNTGACGGNVRHTGGNNPYYNSGRTTPPTTVKNTKTITRAVNENWEQKMPIETMSAERRGFLGELCEKLKYAFNVYGSNFYGSGVGRTPVRRYPGEFESDEWGYDEDGMAGMEAYRALMGGGMWGCYD